MIKAQRDTYSTPKVKTNSQKLGYQKRVRTVDGPKYIEVTTPIATVPLAETFENKRLGKALAVAKVMQDLTPPSQVHMNGWKLGYQKRGRQIYGPDFPA